MQLRGYRHINKRGSQFIEASIVIPIIVLIVALLLRLFTFYVEILTTGINEHKRALAAWDTYKGAGFKKYENTTSISMMKYGLLDFGLEKNYVIEAYLYNEDKLVRGKYLAKTYE